MFWKALGITSAIFAALALIIGSQFLMFDYIGAWTILVDTFLVAFGCIYFDLRNAADLKERIEAQRERHAKQEALWEAKRNRG